MPRGLASDRPPSPKGFAEASPLSPSRRAESVDAGSRRRVRVSEVADSLVDLADAVIQLERAASPRPAEEARTHAAFATA